MADMLGISSNLTAFIGGIAGLVGAVVSIWGARAARSAAEDSRASERRSAASRVRDAARDIVLTHAVVEDKLETLASLQLTLRGFTVGGSGADVRRAQEVATLVEVRAHATRWHDDAQRILQGEAALEGQRTDDLHRRCEELQGWRSEIHGLRESIQDRIDSFERAIEISREERRHREALQAASKAALRDGKRPLG